VSEKPAPSRRFRRRYDATLQLVRDGVDPWLAFWYLMNPSEDMLLAETGELPEGWRWLTEEELREERAAYHRRRQRSRYQQRKSG
jgi:hypothetical protein